MSGGTLAGRPAVVTGAASGIGLACARALAAEGGLVVLSDLAGPQLDSAADGVGVAIAADVTSEVECAALMAETAERVGPVEILVTCAGIFSKAPVDEVTVDEWERVIRVNLTGTLLTAQAALRYMIPRRRGRIVTIASLAAQTGGLAAGVAYAASKGGVIALTKSIARAAAAHGITANAVNPGVIDTPLIAGWPEEAHERTLAATPLGRVGTPEEVAAAVAFLVSDAAAFVTGAHVDVNGGLLMD